MELYLDFDERNSSAVLLNYLTLDCRKHWADPSASHLASTPLVAIQSVMYWSISTVHGSVDEFVTSNSSTHRQPSILP